MNHNPNAANQLTSGNATYDNNGNMTSDSVNSYTWDRANRLLSMGGSSYQYDGEGRRVQQTVSSTVTKYLLDIQPGLAVVLSETTGANTMRYVHSPRGIHAHKDTGSNWEWTIQDGLGSVREVVDNSVGVLESRNYDPYGNPFGATGTSQTGFGFTGELVDGNGLLDLRARRYNAALGVFASLDPLETRNRYAYVDGNPINRRDPSGQETCEVGVCDPPAEGEPMDSESQFPQEWGEYPPYWGTDIEFSGDSGMPVHVTETWQPVNVGESGQVLISTGNVATIAYPNDPLIADGVIAVSESNGAAINILYYRGQNISDILSYMGAYPIGSFTSPQLDEQLHPQLSTGPYVDPVLQAISEGQCLETPNPSRKRCDPSATLSWVLSNATPFWQRANGTRYEYQRHYAGHIEWRIPTGTGENVDADGINFNRCTLVDTKYVGNPKQSPFVLGSTAREDPVRQRLFISSSINPKVTPIDVEQDNLFRRYGLVIRNPETPFVGLEVFTNEAASLSYWQYWINKNNVPSATLQIGPWP